MKLQFHLVLLTTLLIFSHLSILPLHYIFLEIVFLCSNYCFIYNINFLNYLFHLKQCSLTFKRLNLLTTWSQGRIKCNYMLYNVFSVGKISDTPSLLTWTRSKSVLSCACWLWNIHKINIFFKRSQWATLNITLCWIFKLFQQWAVPSFSFSCLFKWWQIKRKAF